MGRVINSNELKRERLERLKYQIWLIGRRIKRHPLHEGGAHPGYLEFGRLIYEFSKQYKPKEIPAPLRACPWVFVLAELRREWPSINWGERAMTRYVGKYLQSLAHADRQPTPRMRQAQLGENRPSGNEGA